MCFGKLFTRFVSWLTGEELLTKENFEHYLEERDRAAKEKKEKEDRDRTKFQGTNPFREFPEYRCLAPEPWLEPFECNQEWESRWKLRAKEQKITPVMESKLEAVVETFYEEIDTAHSISNQALSEVRGLEDRLRLKLGPIPHLPPFDPDVEEQGWD